MAKFSALTYHCEIWPPKLSVFAQTWDPLKFYNIRCMLTIRSIVICISNRSALLKRKYVNDNFFFLENLTKLSTFHAKNVLLLVSSFRDLYIFTEADYGPILECFTYVRLADIEYSRQLPLTYTMSVVNFGFKSLYLTFGHFSCMFALDLPCYSYVFLLLFFYTFSI